MRKILLMASLLFATGAFAQDYKNSIGVRFGSGYYDVVGVAFKTFITQPGALEFDLGFRPHSHWGHDWTSVSIAGTYQHHFPIGEIDGFKWFVGGGLVIANSFSDHNDYSGVNVGIYPTGGVDYKLKSAPFAFSIDVRPTVHIAEGYKYHDGFFVNGGITARYVF